MKKIVSLVFVASLLLFSGSAFAANEAAPGQDGVVKGKQHKQHRKFDDCDKEHTGALSFEEAKDCFPRMSKERFDAIDANKDGKITKEELKEFKSSQKKMRNKTAEPR